MRDLRIQYWVSQFQVLRSSVPEILSFLDFMREAVIVASSRTPLAKSYRGSFNMTRPDDLAAHAIRHVLGKVPALDRRKSRKSSSAAGSRTAGGHNIARVAALRAGLPVTTAAVTVNRFCNSGLQAIVQAAHHGDQRGRGRGDWRRRRVDHDDGTATARPIRGCSSTCPASTWRWATRPKSSRSAITSRREAQDEYRARQPAADRARPAGRLLQRRARADAGDARRARQEDAARRSARKTSASSATNATVPTRRSRACRSCRPSSTRRAAPAASPPATRLSSPTAPRRRS